MFKKYVAKVLLYYPNIRIYNALWRCTNSIFIFIGRVPRAQPVKNIVNIKALNWSAKKKNYCKGYEYQVIITFDPPFFIQIMT